MAEVNPVIGHWTCERGGRADVMQTKKRGQHFYTRCDCCGLNQGTGAARQQAIWDTAEFLKGVTFVRPSNVSEQSAKPALESEPQSEPASDGSSEVLSDFDPSEMAPVSEPKPSVGGSRLLGGALLLGAIGVGLWMN